MDVSSALSLASSLPSLGAKVNPRSLTGNSAKLDNNPGESSMTSLVESNLSEPLKVVDAASNDLSSAAEQFEELFVSTLLKQMRETLEQGLFGEEASDSFGAIFDTFMGKHLAAAKPLGIGQAVNAYLEAGKKNGS